MDKVATRERQNAGLYALIGILGVSWLFMLVGSISDKLTSMRKELLTSMHKELSDISANLSQVCYNQVEARHHSEDLNREITDKLRDGFNSIQSRLYDAETSLREEARGEVDTVLEDITNLREGVRREVETVLEAVTSFRESVRGEVEDVRTVLEDISSLREGEIDTVLKAITSLREMVWEVITGLREDVRGEIDTALEAIRSVEEKIDQL